MTLREILRNIENVEDEKTVIVAEPWTSASLAQFVTEPDGVGPISGMERDGMTYFLEVSIIRELREDLPDLSADAFCERVIQYAMNDA